MIRRYSLAAALVIALAPMSLHALGLGEIHLKSALNQYLNADIDLLSVTSDELPDVRVKLAPPEAFERAGVERPFLLTKLRFKPMIGDDGKAVVHITSRDPIREPFLNFLLEVDWPKGRLVREYTVLLDPPVTLARRPAPIQAAETAAVQPRPSQLQSEPGVTQPSRQPAMEVDEYGPTRRNDTLWSIAKKLRPQGASMQQTMIALLRANPQAFFNNNINNLKVGRILRVPDRQQILALSSREARIAYQEQIAQWQADRAPALQPKAVVASLATAGKAVTTGGQSDQPEEKPQLKIATARPEGKGEAGAAEQSGDAQLLDKLRQDLLIAEEEKASAQREGEELKARLDALESQLEDLQRLLTLKNEQLARLQVLAAEQGGGEPAVETTGKNDQAVAEPAGESRQAVSETAAQATSERQEAADSGAAQAVVPAAKPTEQTAPIRQPPRKKAPGLFDSLGSDPTMLGVAVAAVVVLLALLWVVISRRRSSNADFQESILVSTLDDNDSEQIGEGADLVTQSPDETSFLSDFSPSDIDALQDETGEVDPLAEADVYIAYGRYQQAEELIRQAIEKDPGRIELKHKLFEVLFATKENDEFVALAEACALEGVDRKDPAAWAKVVAMGAQLVPGHALFAGVDADALPQSETALSGEPGDPAGADLDLGDLGQELGLGNELDLSADEDDIAALSLDELEADLGEFASGEPQDMAGDTAAEDTLDFDLDSDFGREDESADELAGVSESTLEDAPEDEGQTVVATGADLGLDLDGLDDPGDLEGLSLEGDETAESDTFDDLEGLALEGLELSEGDEPADGAPPKPALEISDTLVDLPAEDLVLSTENEQAEAAPEDGPGAPGVEELQLEEVDEGLSLDDLEDFGEPLPQDEMTALNPGAGEDEMLSLDELDEGGLADELDLGEPAVGDEAQTKLDLASAYIDMGDPDGARAILEEVLSEGNEDQKRAAQQMLDQIS